MSFRLLHNVGDINHPNYTSKEKILNCNDVLTFDGIYRNVYENKEILKGKKVIFFVMGDFMGKDNSFDLAHVPKLEKYCTWDEVIEMVTEFNAELGWHTWSHRDLTTLSEEEIRKEITPPFPMKSFAFPYGKYNDLVLKLVKEQYEYAYSVFSTDGTNYTIPRPYL